MSYPIVDGTGSGRTFKTSRMPRLGLEKKTNVDPTGSKPAEPFLAPTLSDGEIFISKAKVARCTQVSQKPTKSDSDFNYMPKKRQTTPSKAIETQTIHDGDINDKKSQIFEQQLVLLQMQQNVEIAQKKAADAQCAYFESMLQNIK